MAARAEITEAADLDQGLDDEDMLGDDDRELVEEAADADE